jgi:hypothetical protein
MANHLTSAHTFPWTDVEDRKLKDAVRTHASSWVAIAELVASRTKRQCYDRWRDVLEYCTSRVGYQ